MMHKTGSIPNQRCQTLNYIHTYKDNTFKFNQVVCNTKFYHH